MIASVVATIDDSNEPLQSILDRIARIPFVEIGTAGPNARRIPMTIDSTAPAALEETTRGIQGCRGVAFLDVVFVHFEDESANLSVPAKESQTAHE